MRVDGRKVQLKCADQLEDESMRDVSPTCATGELARSPSRLRPALRPERPSHAIAHRHKTGLATFSRPPVPPILSINAQIAYNTLYFIFGTY